MPSHGRMARRHFASRFGRPGCRSGIGRSLRLILQISATSRFPSSRDRPGQDTRVGAFSSPLFMDGTSRSATVLCSAFDAMALPGKLLTLGLTEWLIHGTASFGPIGSSRGYSLGKEQGSCFGDLLSQPQGSRLWLLVARSRQLTHKMPGRRKSSASISCARRGTVVPVCISASSLAKTERSTRNGAGFIPIGGGGSTER
jgi:hypothetical protein